MVQAEYTHLEPVDAEAIKYINELVAAGEISPDMKVNQCADCAEKGLIRPAIFGEDYCRRCWDGLWRPEEPSSSNIPSPRPRP